METMSSQFTAMSIKDEASQKNLPDVTVSLGGAVRQSFKIQNRTDLNIAASTVGREDTIIAAMTTLGKRDSSITGTKMKKLKSKAVEPDQKIVEVIQADL